MPRLVLLSMKRCGTNWFMDLANRLPGCLAIREAFNPSGVFGIDKRNGVVRRALAERLGIADLGERTPEAIAWARGDPRAFLELAEQTSAAAGFPWFGVTIFNDQIEDDVLAEVLRHRSTRPVVLLRRQLARYVSLVKAQTVGAWKGVDTTAVRPVIDVAAFAEEAAGSRRWFGWLRGIIPDETPVFTYEEHVLGGAGLCVNALGSAFPELAMPSGKQPPTPSICRQDRTDDVFAAVSNGDELRRALIDADLMEEAFSYPWSQPSTPTIA